MSDRWSQFEIERRYARYAKERAAANRRDLSPLEPEKEGSHWIYTPVHRIVEGIEAGDPMCRELGVEFIEESGTDTPFGPVLRSHVARALRRGDLPDALKSRLRARILELLASGSPGLEFKQYAKLLNSIGVTRAQLAEVESRIDPSDEHAMHYLKYLKSGSRD